jgi:hypothetical protein
MTEKNLFCQLGFWLSAGRPVTDYAWYAVAGILRRLTDE